MIRLLPAPAAWISFLAPHPAPIACEGWAPRRPTSWWRDPDNGDLWRTADSDEIHRPTAGLPHPAGCIACKPHLILDTLIVDGVHYRDGQPANYTNLKIPALVALAGAS